MQAFDCNNHFFLRRNSGAGAAGSVEASLVQTNVEVLRREQERFNNAAATRKRRAEEAQQAQVDRLKQVARLQVAEQKASAAVAESQKAVDDAKQYLKDAELECAKYDQDVVTQKTQLEEAQAKATEIEEARNKLLNKISAIAQQQRDAAAEATVNATAANTTIGDTAKSKRRGYEKSFTFGAAAVAAAVDRVVAEVSPAQPQSNAPRRRTRRR